MNDVKKLAYEEKVWGRTAPVAMHRGFTVHHLHIIPESFCSRHLHEHRYNGFFVTRGRLLVREFTPGGDIAKDVLLEAGEYYEVAPGVQHQFISYEGAEALEVYFPPDVTEDDITRFSVGGLLRA